MREQKGGAGGQSAGHKDPCSHRLCWAMALQGVGEDAQRLTSVILSCDQPRDHKEHISKQVQKPVSYFNQGVLVVEVFINQKA